MKNRIMTVFGLLIVLSMVLAACAPAATPTTAPAATQPPAQPPTEEPEAPSGPRKGGWLDEVVVSVVTADAAVTQIEAGAIDIYASGLSSADLPEIESAGLAYSQQNGLYYELTFNPSGDPTFEGTGKLNPFSSAKVREAMNWLVDREYINQEVYAGGALAKFFTFTTQFPDYADLADVVRQFESKYAYNPELANETITAEMEAMGATLVDGKWNFNGEPVVIIVLIRNDSDGTRVPIGDYVANQLETIGFTTDRQYKTSSEASPIWVGGNVADGLFHIYTGAWSATVIDRDQGDNFQFFSTPASGYGFTTLWQAYAISEEFQTIADDLAFNRFTNLEERREAFIRAIELDFEYSFRVWLIDGKNFAPYREGVEVTYDLAAGVDGAQIASYTLRLADQEGGTVKWGQPDLFVDPWNPIAGSNWAFDASVQRFTSGAGLMNDPHTGLAWPLRIESAAVTVEEGLPVGTTLDWVSLDFASEIAVPADAWSEWDAGSQVFITNSDFREVVVDAQAQKAEYDTAYELNQPQLEAKASELASLVDYTAFTSDSFKGLVAELAVFLKDLTSQDTDVEVVLSSEEAVVVIDELVGAVNSTEEPVLTDDEKVERVASTALSFVSIAPFDAELASLAQRGDVSTAQVKSVVTYPADVYDVKWHDGSNFSVADIMMGMIMTFDPATEGSAIFDESQVGNLESFLSVFKGFKIASTDPLVVEYYFDGFQLDAEINVTTLWPTYAYGEAPWHTIAIANMADAAGELAYSADKADAAEIEWTSFIGGPSLEILKAKLDQAAAESLIPYAPTLSQYITAEEAAARYANLASWYDAHGHFWVGSGPYYLDQAFLVEKTAALKQFADFPDLSDRWNQFGDPKVADVEIDGAGQVAIGAEAAFDVFITFEGEAYPPDEIKLVKYLLYDATGAVVSVGEATAVADGQYSVVIPADVTAALAAGANKIEIAVVPFPVAIPTFQSFEFVTAP